MIIVFYDIPQTWLILDLSRFRNKQGEIIAEVSNASIGLQLKIYLKPPIKHSRIKRLKTSYSLYQKKSEFGPTTIINDAVIFKDVKVRDQVEPECTLKFIEKGKRFIHCSGSCLDHIKIGAKSYKHKVYKSLKPCIQFF